VVVLLILIVDLIDVEEDLIVVTVEQLLDDDIDNRQRDSEVDNVLANVDVHVHRVYALDLTVEIHLLAINRKLIIFLPYFDMLFQVQQIVFLDERRFENMNIVDWLVLATC
jgi:hypothetical protein